MIPVPYQVFYIIIPTIGIIGNAFIVYVTIRSKSLRSTCNIMIGWISLGDMLHMFAHYVMVISHNTSHDHLIRQDVCVYLQLIPLCGLFMSSMLLLNVAIDRLLSLQKFYNLFTVSYKKYYIAAQFTPAVLYTLAMVLWTFLERSPETRVVCVITAPLNSEIYAVATRSIMILSALVVVCYVVFFGLLKRTKLADEKMRKISRSLFVISLTVVFGWFSTMFIGSFCQIFHINIERTYVDLLAGLFVNVACSINFFVYFALSNEYRNLFLKYLLLPIYKKVNVVTTSAGLSQERMVVSTVQVKSSNKPVTIA